MTSSSLRIVVTGALGYVGSVLVPMLKSRGHSVTALDVRAPELSNCSSVDPQSFTPFVQADIRDRAAMTRATSDADAIIHLAAVVGYPACDARPEDAKSINETGSEILIAAAPASARLVFLSTTSIYGRQARTACRENASVQPLSLYARTKAYGEEIALKRGCVALRPATAFGISPVFRSDLIIHDFIARGLRGEHLRLFEPDAIRSFIYVGDLAVAIIHSVEQYDAMRGQAYNVASADAVLTKAELADRISALTDLTFEVIDGVADPDGRDYHVDAALLASTGFAQTLQFETHLHDTVSWMRRYRNFGEGRRK